MADLVRSGSVQGAARASALSSLSKEEWFEAKTLPLALESDESLLLKVEPIARLPMSKQKLT